MSKPAKKKPIKIKKSREGSFTKWAKKQGKTKDGKITDAAIQAGLNSKDPRIRRKANFARNSRSWNTGKQDDTQAPPKKKKARKTK